MQLATCSLTTQSQKHQDFFWTWIDQQVQGFVISLIEKALEALCDEYLAAGWNQRTDQRKGYRNGYRHRCLMTPHGLVAIAVPRLRKGTFDMTLIFERYQRRVRDVERILRHAYLVGVSTRDTAKLAQQIFGGALSHQTISQLMRWLDEELIRWRQQPIDPIYSVVYVDGMHVNRVGSDRNVMLVAGRRDDGVMEVLDFCVSTGEQCKTLLENLRKRGLENVQMFVSDQSPAIRSALQEVYPDVPWQHCAFHRLAQLRKDIGATEDRDSIVAQAACIFRCPSRAVALETAADWALRWKETNAVAVARFLEDLTDSLNFYELPITWWKRVRTNNPLERLIRTLRIRIRPMGTFANEPAIQRALFGQLLRWHKIKLTH